jgi:NifU-like protein involved in Fe-S cluster formation
MSLSPTALTFARDSSFRGKLANATHHGLSGSPGDGPFMEIWLSIHDERIRGATYQTYGCPTAMACSALACKLLLGRSLDEAGLLSSEDLVLILGGVPEGKEHCPRMTNEAIDRAIHFPIKEHV